MFFTCLNVANVVIKEEVYGYKMVPENDKIQQ